MGSEAYRRTRRPPITVRWVDVNKGDDATPNYRSRLVAREMRDAGEESTFAPTPPLEALRTVLSLAATDMEGDEPHVRDPKSEDRTQVSIIDIARAYLNANVNPDKPAYVDLPQEDPGHSKGQCGLLLRHMYGTKKAAEGWHDEYSGTLTEMGFIRGDSSACVLRHK